MPESPSSTVRVSASGDPKSAHVDVLVGNTVRLELQERSSSGFIWSFDDRSADDISISELGRSAGQRPGEASTRIMAITPRRVGNYEIEFRLGRPWLRDRITADFRLNLQVIGQD